MKQHLSKLLLCAAISISTVAQAQYVTDLTSHHNISGGSLDNKAIYTDDVTKTYFIPQTSNTSYNSIFVSQTDQDFNLMVTYTYTSAISSMYFTPFDIDEIPVPAGAKEQMVVVGDYINEGYGRGSFILCFEKTTGSFLWYREYPDIIHLNSCATSPKGVIAVGHREEPNPLFPITGTTGVILAVDPNGSYRWQKEFESNKYMFSNLGLGAGSIQNMLRDVTKINKNTYAAVGFTNSFALNMYPYYDGDGTLVIFNDGGITLNQMCLGNPTPLNFGGSQTLQFETLEGVAYDPNDQSLVMSGFAFESPVTQPMPSCPGPDLWGVWATKLDLAGFSTTWSNIYDFSANPPGVGNIIYMGSGKVIYDNNGNFGITFHDPYINPWMQSNSVIFKVEPTAGNQLYSRQYTLNNKEGLINRIGNGMNGVPDIVTVGHTYSAQFVTDGWNLTAFDNIWNYCESNDFPMIENYHHYDLFDLFENQWPHTEVKTDLTVGHIPINNYLPCPRIHQKPAPTGINEVVMVAYNVEGNTIDLNIGDESYNGAILNALGQTLRKLENVTGSFKIDMNGTTPGLYYLQLSNGKNKIARAIPIQ